MRVIPRGRPSHATAVAYLALFVALGGSAYAATSLPASSVGTTQLKAGSVTAAKLHAHAVTARAVGDHSLTGLQIDASTLGTVPTAMVAFSADSAYSATNAANAMYAGHATDADHATGADHAASADEATQAGNSDLFGGQPVATFQSHCVAPSMLTVPGLCIEPAARTAATWAEALATCQGNDRRLPTTAELALAYNNLVAVQPVEWTSDVYHDGQMSAVTVSQDASRLLTVDASLLTAQLAYRCVTIPITG